MKKHFLVCGLLLIAICTVMVSCYKEEATPASMANHTTVLKGDPEEFFGRHICLAPMLEECRKPPEACMTWDVVVEPAKMYSYQALQTAIEYGTEHEFFDDDCGRDLFPFLYYEGLEDYLDVLLNEDNKLIKVYNSRTGIELYVCTNDDVDPGELSEDDELLTLTIKKP